MENEQSWDWDEVSRACDRIGCRRDSSLASDVRKNLYYIVGVDMVDRDKKLDAFMSARRADPTYANSFVDPPRSSGNPGISKEQPVNMLRLTPEEFEEIAAGKIAVERVK